MSLHEYLMADPQCDQLLAGAVLAVGPMLDAPDPAPTLAVVEGWADELAGRMRLYWRGFDGGEEARQSIAEFMGAVRSRARRLREER